MVDERIKKYAKILVEHSSNIKKGDIIVINGSIEAKELMLELCKLILKKGATPRPNVSLPGFGYVYYTHAPETVLKQKPLLSEFEVKNTQGVISIISPENTRSLNNTDPKKSAIRSKLMKPLSEYRLKQDNWVLCAYPTQALAQDADMGLEEFQDYVYDAVLVDYKKMTAIQTKVKALYDRSSEIRVTGPELDITVGIKGRKGIMCTGLRNVPDGEVFVGPEEHKTEGHVTYSFPAIYHGREVEGVHLEFHKGQVVKATATKNQKFLREMIAMDPGAKRLGEFSFGLNYNLKKHIKQILFDEKMGGTIHMALGMAYKKGGGKNESALHWDMIKDMRKGGKAYFDGKLMYKNGKFMRFK